MCKVNQVREQDVDVINQRKCFWFLSQMGILRQRIFSLVSNCLEPTKFSSLSPTLQKWFEFDHFGAIGHSPGRHVGPLSKFMIDCSIHLLSLWVRRAKHVALLPVFRLDCPPSLLRCCPLPGFGDSSTCSCRINIAGSIFMFRKGL